MMNLKKPTVQRANLVHIKFLLISGIVFYITLRCYYTNHFGNIVTLVKLKEKALWKWSGTNTRVRVLVWSSYFHQHSQNNTEFQKMIGVDKMDCSDWCEVVGDRKMERQSDALVWHGWPGDVKLYDLPHYRNPDQPWVWWSRESPYLTSNGLEIYNGLFNWTMTYRQDSDVLYSYGHTIPLESPRSLVDLEWLSRNISIYAKNKMIVGVISDCNTPAKRERLIELMRSHGLPIDIYGRCGTRVMERDDVFWKRLSREYKFYLAFENALCKDYVTEKLWRTLNLGMVPIVYGGANYTQVAPPNSFIDIRKFGSIEEVVHFLKLLDNEPTIYAKYFDWRKRYSIYQGGRGFCALCEKIRAARVLSKAPSPSDSNRRNHIPPTSTYKQVYLNLYNWWVYVVNETRVQDNQITKISSRPACQSPEEEWFWKGL